MNVYFVCVGNAGRSQMAEALYGARGGNARSAGSRPERALHPEVLDVMRERGIDLSDRAPKAIDRESVEWADIVVTMGCGDACPYIPGKQYVDWELTDPKGRSLDDVRAIRDEIDRRVADLPI